MLPARLTFVRGSRRVGCVILTLAFANVGFMETAWADHGDMFPECPDYEELGTNSNTIVGGNLQYIQLAPGQSKHTVTSVGSVSGYCEIRGAENRPALL
jgi:hypothetical protein